MTDNNLPPERGEERVRRALAFYKQQTEAALQPAEMVMNVPRELVPVVRS